MLIKFQAYTWDCKASQLPLTTFISRLVSQRPVDYIGHRKIYTTKIEHDRYIRGLLLTVKQLRKFCTLLDEQGAVRLTAHQLDKNEQVADFNFFILDTKSSRGMYQYYHQSCSLPAFNTIFKSIYADFLTAMKNVELNASPEEKENKIFLKQLRNKYFGTLQWSIIERKGSFEERIKLLKQLKALEFEYSVLQTEENRYEPIFPYLTRSKNTISFKKTDSPSIIPAAVGNWLSNQELKKAKAIGLDQQGQEITYKLFHDYDKFAERDYDDLVPSLSLDSADIENSINNNEVIKELITAFEDASIAIAKYK